MHRFLTPDEARALGQPHVQAEVRRINDDLCAGHRGLSTTPSGIAEVVIAGLRAAGWVVTEVQPTPYGRTLFHINDPVEDGNSLAKAGHELATIGTRT